jgi:hypothetical protein
MAWRAWPDATNAALAIPPVAVKIAAKRKAAGKK